MGEEIISSHVNRGSDACIVRLFNVVGPKMDLKHTNYGQCFQILQTDYEKQTSRNLWLESKLATFFTLKMC